MAKKQPKYNIVKNENTNDYSKIILIIIGIVLVVGLLYLYTGFFVTKELSGKKDEPKTPETVINYDEIIAGTIFSQSPETYYVLISDFKTYNYKAINALLDQSDDIKYFSVDLSKTINQSIIGEPYITNNPETLRVSDPTLLIITSGKITKSIIGLDNINNYLK